MKELSNLSIVFSTPERLTSRDFWNSKNKKKPISKPKTCFWENAVEYLRNGECKSFQIFAIVFSTPKNLLVGTSGALGMKRIHFLS